MLRATPPVWGSGYTSFGGSLLTLLKETVRITRSPYGGGQREPLLISLQTWWVHVQLDHASSQSPQWSSGLRRGSTTVELPLWVPAIVCTGPKRLDYQKGSLRSVLVGFVSRSKSAPSPGDRILWQRVPTPWTQRDSNSRRLGRKQPLHQPLWGALL